MSFEIQEPVSELPPIHRNASPLNQWGRVYRMVERTPGLWIPVVFRDRADAKRLAESARKCLHRNYDAEVRGHVCFVRTREPRREA